MSLLETGFEAGRAEVLLRVKETLKKIDDLSPCDIPNCEVREFVRFVKREFGWVLKGKEVKA